MRAALDAYDAETERILLELETVRGRLLADEGAAAERLAALQDELETLAEPDGLRRWGIRHLGCLSTGPRRPDHGAMTTITDRMRRKTPAPLHRDLRVPALAAQEAASRSSETSARPRSPSTACAAGTSPRSTPTAP